MLRDREGSGGSTHDRRKLKEMMPVLYDAYKSTHRHGMTNRGWPYKADDPILVPMPPRMMAEC